MLTRVLVANDRAGRALAGMLLAIAVLVPIANLLPPEGSWLHVPTYTVSLLGKYLALAILALALDLVWGYCGILSLGHGAFFGLGGYAMGMYLMRQIGDRGVYGDPVLPDFMARHSGDLVQVLPETIEIQRTFWLVAHQDQRDRDHRDQPSRDRSKQGQQQERNDQ